MGEVIQLHARSEHSKKQKMLASVQSISAGLEQIESRAEQSITRLFLANAFPTMRLELAMIGTNAKRLRSEALRIETGLRSGVDLSAEIGALLSHVGQLEQEIADTYHAIYRQVSNLTNLPRNL
ncbi:MAG: hypothetical protein ACM3Q1_18820 [Bacteroidales bacterium]